MLPNWTGLVKSYRCTHYCKQSVTVQSVQILVTDRKTALLKSTSSSQKKKKRQVLIPFKFTF